KMQWMSYSLRGKQFRESTGTCDEQQARKILKNKLREVHADQIGARKFVTPQASRLTIADLVAALRAKLELDGQLSPQNACELNKLEEDFGRVRAVELTAEKVDSYKKERLAEDYKPATINRRLVFLVRCFSLAIERGHLTTKPHIELLPVSNARQGFVDDPTFRKIYGHLPADLKDFCLFAFLTAWRKGELSCLKWKHVQNGMIRIPAEETKSGVARSVVIAGELTEVIERRQAAKGFKGADGTIQTSEYIFHREGAAVIEFRKAWATACTKAGCAGLLVHDLRRSGVRNLIRSGVPQNVAMKISGHETTAMFKRYDIASEDDLKAAAESVTKYNADQSAKAAAQSNVVSFSK
ncbi:MAG: site-specific integrase, partial [Candidatus Acidiferrales bacterium]